MKEMDPRLKKIEIILKDSLKKTKSKNIQTNNIALDMWPSYTIEELLKHPFFYKEPIIQPTTLNKYQYLKSLKDKKVSQEIINEIILVNIEYRGFDNKTYQGQVIIHKDLKSSIKKIFKRILLETQFPMTSVLPISMFNWNTSSRLNNCGAFDWRFVENSDEVSDHTFGAAIDINSILNPWVKKGQPNSPNYTYNPKKRGALHKNSEVVKIFKEEGWKWGGDWKNSKDRMHFYRPDITYKYYGKVEVEK